MLYPSRLIAEETLGAVPMEEPLSAPDCFLSALHILNGFFEERPALLVSPREKTTTLLYRNAAYLWQDIAERVGILAVWAPIRFFGTTEGRETAELTFDLAGSSLTALRRSVSGRDFDHLQGLGLQIEWPDRDAAIRMAELAGAVSCRMSCCAFSHQNQAVLDGSRLTVPTEGSLFLYLAWEPLSHQALLEALTIAHKARLWRVFLENGLQPLEFDWLWECYLTGEPLFLLEWELALRTVLEELKFRVERSDHAFHVLDSGGKERRFDIARGGPAEKVFLKLLFPLNGQ